MLVFDIETTGLLGTMDRIHCINFIDRSTGKQYAFNGGKYADGSKCQRDGSVEDGVAMLMVADAIAGQNIIGFDIPAIKKIYPYFVPHGRVIDTKVMSQVIYTDLMDRDMKALRNGRLPHEFQKKGLINSHKLEAWGYRLGCYKGEFGSEDDPERWLHFTQDMDVYGRQDPVVTLKLLETLEGKQYSQECLDLEHAVAAIIFRQVERGFAFDMKAAEALTQKLQVRHAEISALAATAFPPWQKSTGIFVPKKDDKKRGYVKGVGIERFKEVVFNPGSRQHVADRLGVKYGWIPMEFTPSGEAKIDETILGALPYPEAKILAEYFTVDKRLGQVATGDQSWFKHATPNGIYGRPTGSLRIHGGVTSNGAVTGRMTHARPNVAQTPKIGSPYGEECRACWIPSPGLALVGCDAEGLELRMLAHFMAKWDGGAYVETVINGKKEDGTDVHSVNRKGAGMNDRENAKTFIYALLYGAGDYKLGTIIYEDFTDLQRSAFLEKHKSKRQREAALKSLGAARRARLVESLPAFGKLVKAVKSAVKTKGYLVGLDGRKLHIRSEHAALNTLLQSAGALVMKKALVLFDTQMDAEYRHQGYVVEPVANIHDEAQIESTPEIAHDVGKVFATSIKLAGEYFKLRCPLSGSYGVGKSWAETH